MHRPLDKPMNEKEKFGKFIKDLRISRELTQEEVSQLSGVTFSTINRLERGLANPTLETIDKILKVYGFELTAQRALRAEF